MSNKQKFFDAVAKGNVEDVRSLLSEDQALASALNEHGVSAILVAAYNGKKEMYELLRSKKSALTLFEAAAIGAVDAVRRELKQTPVNEYSADGFTALHLTAFFGHPAAAECLIEAGADVNLESKNPARLAPLNSAAACRDLNASIAIARLLLVNGANPNHAQNGGYAPLHSAAANGNGELVSALIAAGAKPSAQSADGRTAASLAKERGHTELAATLA